MTPAKNVVAGPLGRAAFQRREGVELPAPPARIVHIGLGAFHRAHQAWYTARAADGAEWGIAAFTGRSPLVAGELSAQDGLYTLVERSGTEDRLTVLPNIVEAVDGADVARLVELVSSPQTAIVTITITESGYRLRADGSPNEDDPGVAGDIAVLRAASASAHPMRDLDRMPETALGRLALALDARRRSGAGPIAIVPCDNMPDNGPLVRNALIALARAGGGPTATWIGTAVSFVSTSVDRITPKTTEADVAEVATLSGWHDAAPVVTEPFADWVLSGEFPAGRPAWETAGARFVDDIEPFERRKLWMLNGAHSLLAYAGTLRGHETVAAAIADPDCLASVREFWDAAARHLPDGLGLDDYRTALIARFSNVRIEHRLGQIGMEAVAKLRVRAAPIVLAERADGRDGDAALQPIAAWIVLCLAGAAPADADAVAIADAVACTADAAVPALIALVDERLAADDGVIGRTLSLVESLRSNA